MFKKALTLISFYDQLKNERKNRTLLKKHSGYEMILARAMTDLADGNVRLTDRVRELFDKCPKYAEELAKALIQFSVVLRSFNANNIAVKISTVCNVQQ